MKDQPVHFTCIPLSLIRLAYKLVTVNRGFMAFGAVSMCGASPQQASISVITFTSLVYGYSAHSASSVYRETVELSMSFTVGSSDSWPNLIPSPYPFMSSYR